MTIIVADRVKETSTTTGTGDFTVAGALTGFRAFSSVCSVNDIFEGVIEAVDGSGQPTGEWESGTYTYSGTNTIARTTVRASSNGGSAVNFSAGTKHVWLDYTAYAISGFPTPILENTTITVNPGGGGDYTTLIDALASLDNKWIAPTATVTIELADGQHTSSTAHSLSHPCGMQIQIKGQNVYTKTLNSIQSTSGSAGAYSYVLNLADVTNIAVNDYVRIPRSVTGGSNTIYTCGCHKVTNVDGVNNRITVTSHNRSANKPSGSVTGTITVIKSRVTMTGVTGFFVSGAKIGLIDQLVVEGDGTTGAHGVLSLFSGNIQLGSNFCATGFDSGIRAGNNGGVVMLDGAVAQGNANGFVAAGAGFLTGNNNNLAVGNTSNGFWSSNTSHINAGATATAIGNGGTGFIAQGGSYLRAASASSNGDTTSISPTVNTFGNNNSTVVNA